MKFLQSWEDTEKRESSEKLIKDIVWALQAVHVPDMYYQIYDLDPEGKIIDQEGIFMPGSAEEFREMVEMWGLDPDDVFDDD